MAGQDHDLNVIEGTSADMPRTSLTECISSPRSQELEQTLAERRLKITEERLRLEHIRTHLEERRLNLLERMMDAIVNPKFSAEAASLLANVAEILKSSDLAGSDEPGPSSSGTVSEDQNPYIPRSTDPCVQKYDADLELVEVYETIREAARRNPNAKTFDITSAISNNTLYLGSRWTMVARENKDVSQTLEPTRNSTKRIRDKVAKIDPATGTIVALFPDGAAAAVSLAMGKGAVTTAIAKNDGVLTGFVWKYWGDCTTEEQTSYEGDATNVSTAGSAKRVRQLDPETGAVVKTWTNMQDLVLAFKTSHKTINKKTADGSVFKGFRWQVTE